MQNICVVLINVNPGIRIHLLSELTMPLQHLHESSPGMRHRRELALLSWSMPTGFVLSGEGHRENRRPLTQREIERSIGSSPRPPCAHNTVFFSTIMSGFSTSRQPLLTGICGFLGCRWWSRLCWLCREWCCAPETPYSRKRTEV